MADWCYDYDHSCQYHYRYVKICQSPLALNGTVPGWQVHTPKCARVLQASLLSLPLTDGVTEDGILCSDCPESTKILHMVSSPRSLPGLQDAQADSNRPLAGFTIPGQSL